MHYHKIGESVACSKASARVNNGSEVRSGFECRKASGSYASSDMFLVAKFTRHSLYDCMWSYQKGRNGQHKFRMFGRYFGSPVNSANSIYPF